MMKGIPSDFYGREKEFLRDYYIDERGVVFKKSLWRKTIERFIGRME